MEWADDFNSFFQWTRQAYAMLGVGPENFSQRLFPEQLAA